MSESREIVCCDFCGRDTANKCHICSQCTRGIRKHTTYEEPDEPRFAMDAEGSMERATLEALLNEVE